MTEKKNATFMNRRQAISLLGAAGVMAPAMIGRDKAFAANADPSGQLTLAFSQEPTVFNPLMPHIEVDEGVYYAVFDPLFDFDPDGNFFPILVAEVPTVANGGISADGLQWKVKLKPGVTWHDGTPFTAEDVKFSLELTMDPDFRSFRSTGYKFMQNITAVSDTELTWEMSEPFAPMAAILASTYIIPKHAFDGVADKNTAPFNNAPIGTGPFKFKQRMAGDHIEFEANTDYHMDGPYLKTLIIKYVPDLNVMYTQFKSGDIDVIGLQYISPDHLGEAEKLPGKVVKLAGAATFESIGLNMTKPQFQDPAVRKALYMALDKASIIDALYYGVPKPTETYMPQQSFYYNPDLPKHEFSIEKANALLDEAGWKKGADGIREKDGVKLAFTNSTTAGNHLREQAQQFFQQTFEQIGVKVTIKNFPPAVMWGDYWMNSEFDSVVVGLNCLAGADPDTSDYFMSTMSPIRGGSGQNTFAYQNPKVDELLVKGAASFVPEERKPIYQEIQQIIRDDLPFLPVFQYALIKGWKSDVSGVEPNVNNRIDTWNVRDWKRS
ncbi:peptide ABC transporter substrate-binding protein [Pseudooceanicola sp. CBS1P-1]|uniref:Peptide ABC transporter substrate-binding protein n=1 Tax=Pseudooceanicola albus TaxID=2692189 RepID=A0A6L7G7G6_9RHOB|nr:MULTISPECIES: peptide ABC transporter substrate-binding protein [Pseudooceanicola]MBT9384297.1 peptide ABC transporter substrate-binding protein [Pseudooceanicola endophyticus]MXN19965.1 peptide ABC transporter substrate-binding protein [Pseudooceanicola albus]